MALDKETHFFGRLRGSAGGNISVGHGGARVQWIAMEPGRQKMVEMELVA